MTASSRVGCVRTNNEDMVLAFNKLVRSDSYNTEFESTNSDRFVVAVADGMGGHNAGEIASETTLSNLQYYISDLPRKLSPDEFHEAINQWLASINKIVDSRGRADNTMSAMGTTLVGMLYYSGRYYVINCGDSRLYRFRHGEIRQLTVDHSLNTMTGQKKHSNVITNCIGAGCKNSYLDFDDITDDILPNDKYLICSDGLNDMVSDDILCKLLQQGATAGELCEEAIMSGGYDNVSACVITVY